MTNSILNNTPIRHYYYDSSTNIIHYSNSLQTSQNLSYIGSSNNPNPKMAASVFLQDAEIQSGFTIQEIV